MIVALQTMQGHLIDGYVVDVIDVDQHPALEAKWGDKVPVLLDGDEEICHYFLDQDRLRLHLVKHGLSVESATHLR